MMKSIDTVKKYKMPTGKKANCLVVLTLMYLIPVISRLGFIQKGDISITLLHIPVILTTILLGLPEGIYTSVLFGISSIEIVSFFSTGEIDKLFMNPLLAITPRIILPFIVWTIYKILSVTIDDNSLSAKFIINAFTALCGSIANTLLVLVALAIIYPDMIGATDSISYNNIIVSSMLGVNVRSEAFIAIIVTILVTILYYKLSPKNNSDAPLKPLKITFQKWMFLFMVSTFFTLFIFIYAIMTGVEYKKSETLLLEKSYDIANIYSKFGQDIKDDALNFGNNGIIMIVENDTVTRSGEPDFIGHHITSIIDNPSGYESGIYQSGLINSVSVYYMCNTIGDTLIITLLPVQDIFSARNGLLIILFVGLLIIFIFMFRIISKLLKNNVVDQVDIINNALVEIRSGNLDERINVNSNSEFEALSLGINSTVATLKDTMDKIDAKNRQEREFAREIQYSALPNCELCQSSGNLYSIWGSMDTAEEVGGDFYDVYMIDDTHIGFVIADVSGKGIPAALFMMTSKTILKDLILSGKTPAQALKLANDELSTNNEKGMFVTAWLGIADLETGHLTFANAGHNPPILIKKDTAPKYMDHKKYSRSIMLGFMPGTKYTDNVLDFSSGDMLLLYTDGVTEAHNPDKKLYGEDRLLRCVDNNRLLNVKELLTAIRADVDTFAMNAEQFDDITMVSFKCN